MPLPSNVTVIGHVVFKEVKLRPIRWAPMQLEEEIWDAQKTMWDIVKSWPSASQEERL
jgi:hypothetical protein